MSPSPSQGLELGFIRSGILRHSAERAEDALDRHRADPNALFVMLAGDIPILRATPSGATGLLPPADLARAPQTLEQVMLGSLLGRPVIASLVPPETADLFRDDDTYRVADLRSIAVQGLVPADELGTLATAKSMLHWHANHRFCARCGAPTTPTSSGFRRDCANCGAQHFPRTDPVAIMLVARGDACLLGRQSRFVPGMYSCLAGFIEPGETIEDAVRRETLEESGIQVGAVRYLASQPWPFPSSLMIGCLAEALTEALDIDREELEDARWFKRDEVRLMLDRTHPDGLTSPPPMAIAHHLLRAFVDGEA